MPKRIQRKRTKGWRLPAGAVCVSRPGRWGNPFRVQACGGGAAEAVSLFRQIFDERCVIPSVAERYPTAEEIQRALRGKDLACWCPLGQPCHADVLLEIANREAAA